MRLGLAIAIMVLVVSARSALGVCCQCATATSPPAPATSLCSGSAVFCDDMGELGASAQCASFGGTFSQGAPGLACPSDNGIGSLCVALQEPTSPVATAPALSWSALAALVCALMVGGHFHMTQRPRPN
jgi:hypothetical protein